MSPTITPYTAAGTIERIAEQIDKEVGWLYMSSKIDPDDGSIYGDVSVAEINIDDPGNIIVVLSNGAQFDITIRAREVTT